MQPDDRQLIGWTIAGAVALAVFIGVCDWASTHAVAICTHGRYGSCYYQLK